MYHSFSLVLVLVFLFGYCQQVSCQIDEEDSDSLERFKIEGTIQRPNDPSISDVEWFSSSRIYTNSGYSAFIRSNGTFVMHNLPWGSHFLYVSNPTTAYPALRIDITSKGKWRVRKVNNLQPTKVETIPLPLNLVPMGSIRYFQPREQWRLTDMLFSPMVLMTVVPLLLILMMPKLGDAETRKEMEAAQLQMPKMETPDLSEFMTNLFKGSSSHDRRPKVTSGSGGAGPSRGIKRKDK